MLAQRQEGLDSDIKEIKKDVSQMAQRSGRRWDMIVEKAIAAIAGALVGFILLKLGLGIRKGGRKHADIHSKKSQAENFLPRSPV